MSDQQRLNTRKQTKLVCNFSLAVTDRLRIERTNYPKLHGMGKDSRIYFQAEKRHDDRNSFLRRKERPYVDKDGKKHKGEYFLVSELKVLIYMEEPEEYPAVKTEPEAIPDKSYADMYPDEPELPF